MLSSPVSYSATWFIRVKTLLSRTLSHQNETLVSVSLHPPCLPAHPISILYFILLYVFLCLSLLHTHTHTHTHTVCVCIFLYLMSLLWCTPAFYKGKTHTHTEFRELLRSPRSQMQISSMFQMLMNPFMCGWMYARMCAATYRYTYLPVCVCGCICVSSYLVISSFTAQLKEAYYLCVVNLVCC